MTHGILPPDALERLAPEKVSPALIPLCVDAAPTRMILLAGAGSFEAAHITMTRGIHLADTATAGEQLCARLAEVSDRDDETVPGSGFEQYRSEVGKAAAESSD